MSSPLLKGGPINNWNTLRHKQSTITGITAEKHIFKWCSFYLSSCASVLHHFLTDKHNKLARFQNTWPLNIYSTTQKQFDSIGSRLETQFLCLKTWTNRVSRYQNQVTSFKKLEFSNSQHLKGFQENDLFLEKNNYSHPHIQQKFAPTVRAWHVHVLCKFFRR